MSITVLQIQIEIIGIKRYNINIMSIIKKNNRTGKHGNMGLKAGFSVSISAVWSQSAGCHGAVQVYET